MFAQLKLLPSMLVRPGRFFGANTPSLAAAIAAYLGLALLFSIAGVIAASLNREDLLRSAAAAGLQSGQAMPDLARYMLNQGNPYTRVLFGLYWAFYAGLVALFRFVFLRLALKPDSRFLPLFSATLLAALPLLLVGGTSSVLAAIWPPAGGGLALRIWISGAVMVAAWIWEGFILTAALREEGGLSQGQGLLVWIAGAIAPFCFCGSLFFLLTLFSAAL